MNRGRFTFPEKVPYLETRTQNTDIPSYILISEASSTDFTLGYLDISQKVPKSIPISIPLKRIPRDLIIDIVCDKRKIEDIVPRYKDEEFKAEVDYFAERATKKIIEKLKKEGIKYEKDVPSIILKINKLIHAKLFDEIYRFFGE